MRRARTGAFLATLVASVACAGCGSSGNGPVTLNWYVFPEPSGSFQGAATACSNASGGRYNIKINFLSTASDQQRVSLVRRLAANDSSIDILAMDVDWTAEFANATRRGGAGIGRGLHGAHIAAHHDGDVPCADVLLADENDVGGFDHGIGCFDRSDETFGFDKSQRF